MSRWFARFAIRRTSSADERLLINSECEPWSSIVDVTDCCVETQTSAEVWLEVLVVSSPTSAGPWPSTGNVDRMYVGWIDENGRLHARRSSAYDARQLVERLATEMGDGVEVEECRTEISSMPNARKVTGYEVWVRVPRRDSLLALAEGGTEPVHAYHRFLAAVVRVG